MATHVFKARRWHNVLGTLPAELEIDSGDTIVTRTIDASGVDEQGVLVSHGPNPMNGPIAVRGARPGDGLRVDILRIDPTRTTGWTRGALAANVIEPEAARGLPKRDLVTWTIDEATVRLAEPLAGLEQLVLPLDPMLGCFGVAPGGGEAISTATSAQHGGNMDYRRFRAGTSVTFPIAVEGALFFVGDCHAIQGDGEIVGTGVETCCEVELRLTLEPASAPVWPRGETQDFIFTIGNARPLEQALQHATTEMYGWLRSGFGLSSAAAAHLMGQVVRYEVGNVFDPAFTMACLIEKRWLPRR